MTYRLVLAGLVLSCVLVGQAVQVRGWPELLAGVVAGGFFYTLAAREQ